LKTLLLSFQFNQESDAKLALDSLQELGYHPFVINHYTVDLHVDLESPAPYLEIMLAHGGELLVDEHSPSADEIFSQAYQLDSYSDKENESTEQEETTIDTSEEEYPPLYPYAALTYDEHAIPEENTKRMF
jgi:hypothetical protein